MRSCDLVSAADGLQKHVHVVPALSTLGLARVSLWLLLLRTGVERNFFPP